MFHLSAYQRETGVNAVGDGQVLFWRAVGGRRQWDEGGIGEGEEGGVV